MTTAETDTPRTVGTSGTRSTARDSAIFATPSPRSVLLHLAVGAGLVIGYVALAWLGRELGAIGSLTVWYPPAGLALAATILIGWRAVPLLALGELIGSVLVFDADAAFTEVQLVLNAVGYATLWGLGGEAIRRGAASPDLRRILAQVVLALGVGVIVAPLAAAFFGVGMQRWAGVAEDPFLEAVGVWWTGDAVGVASVAPTLVVVAWAVRRRRRGEYRMFAGSAPAWVALQLAAPMLVAVAVFATSGEGVRFPYLVVVPVVLVALRFGIEGAAISTCGLTPLVTSLVDGLRDADTIDRAELQTLLLVGIATGLIVGAVVSERERLGRLHRELSAVIETTPDLVSIVDSDGHLRYLNPAARAVVGIDDDADIGGLRDIDLDTDPVAALRTEQARLAAHRDGSWVGEVTLRDTAGREITGSKVIVVHEDRSGNLHRTTSIIRDMSEQRRLEEQLTRRALYDDLTGLPNRTLLLERLDHAQRRRGSVVLLLAVIDRFALITDGVGHAAGDEVIHEVGRRLVGHLRAADTVARLDHDAFGILVDDLDEPAATAMGDQLLEAVAGPMQVRGGRTVHISVSMGAAFSTSPQPVDDLVRAAEVAARRAMEVGGARTVLYREGMYDNARHRLDTELELRDAIDRERWWLAYQPIIDLRTGWTVGSEALLRWSDAEGQLVSPYEFVVLAEETGLIVDLGQSVLRRACLESLGWSDHGQRLTVAVNVSARQLTEPGFTDSVAEVLRRTGIDPGVVTVELTETSFAGDPGTLRPLLDQLGELGVELAMDDFGTGYSSLAQLSGLPLTKVKLDKTFIDDLATSPRCHDLVKGVITLAHALGLTVIAEGVEDESQLAILQELGCDRAQGYLFSRPLPPEELSEHLVPAGPSSLDPVIQARIDRYG